MADLVAVAESAFALAEAAMLAVCAPHTTIDSLNSAIHSLYPLFVARYTEARMNQERLKEESR